MDRRATAGQQPGDSELVCQRDSGDRSAEQGTASAGQQHDTKISRCAAADQPENPVCAVDYLLRRFIDARRTSAVQVNPLQFADTVFRHVDPACEFVEKRRSGQRRFEAGSHAGTGFSGTDNDHLIDSCRIDDPSGNPQSGCVQLNIAGDGG